MNQDSIQSQSDAISRQAIQIASQPSSTQDDATAWAAIMWATA